MPARLILIILTVLLFNCNNEAYAQAKDTTHITFSEPQVQKIITALKPQSDDIMSPGAVALLGALIGALSAILAQLIIHILTHSKERGGLLRDLISEERSLALLILEFYRELAWLKVTYEFWYRSHTLTNEDSDYQQFLSARDKIIECKRNISAYRAKYFKAVTHFAILIKKKNTIQQSLNGITDFTPLAEESSTFLNINDIGTLNDESEIEVKRLKSEYQKLGLELDKIYNAMIKLL